MTDQAQQRGGGLAEACLSSDDALFRGVRALLRSWTLAQLLSRKPPSSVVTLPASGCTCGQALRVLANSSISSAPVFDGDTFVGFLDVGDILRELLTLVNVRELSEENREYKLRAAGLQLEHQQLRGLSLAQDGALIYKADASSTLHDVLLYGFLQPNVAGCMQVVHRVGVFDAADDTSDDDMAPADVQGGVRGIRITHVVSQSDIVHFLHKQAGEMGPLADLPLSRLGLADKAVVCVPGEMSTINALASMVANRVSCVGVISHAHGSGLVASLSSSDLRGLLPEHFAGLGAPVLQFLTARASAGRAAQHPPAAAAALPSTPPQQPPQQPRPLLRQQSPQQPVAGSAHAWGLKGAEGLRLPELVSCTPQTTLREVLELMARHQLHRLHVLDGRRRPLGIVTITDLLRAIVGCTELLQAFGPDIDELEEEEVQQPADPPDCGMGLDTGQELIEGRRGMLPVPSTLHTLLNTAAM